MLYVSFANFVVCCVPLYRAQVRRNIMQGLINKMRNILRDPSLPSRGLAPGTAKKASSKRHIPGGLLPGHGSMRSGHQSSAGSLASLYRHPTPAILVFLAILALGLLFLLPGGLLQAQSAEQFFTYTENSTDPVATFTASDPEGAGPIYWSLTNAEVDIDGDNTNDIVDADIIDRDDLEISQSGVLTFMTPPDFEAPSGSSENDSPSDPSNTYRVVVQASDGTNVELFKVIVTVTNEDERGKVTWTVDPDGADSIAAIPGGLLQFRTGAQLAATVTDPDSATPTVTSWKWYRSSSMSATGTQISGQTTDTYDVSDAPSNNDVGSYIRVEATYRDSATGPSKTVSFTSENPVLGVRGNQPPEFVSDAVSRRIAENAAVGDPVGGPITASDADGDTLTYSIPATTDNFAINAATGQLTVKAGAMLNHDATDGDSQDVVVTANDPSGSATLATTTVTINITDVNEAPTFADFAAGTPPTNPSVAAIAENSMGTALQVGTYNAMDPDDDTASLSLMGPDAGMFQLDSDEDTDSNSATAIRIVRFKASPDYDMPGDSNKDNVYEVTVRASDGANHKDMQVAVKVTDIDEDGKVKLSSQDAQIGVELMATLSDDDGGVPNAAQFTDQKWTWHRLASTATDNNGVSAENAIAGATSATYTPVSADSGMILAAMVSYTDRHGMTTWTSDITRAVRAATANQAPEFSEGTSTFRIIMENAQPNTADNATQGNVGGPIMATDVNDDALAYTLSGADAGLFKVTRIATGDDEGQPQIELKSGTKLDYETRNRYSVTLTANDGSDTSNATARITVTIYVTDVDEKPKTAGRQMVDYAENGTGRVATFTARDPERATPISWSLAADTFTLDVNGDGDFIDPDDVAAADSEDGSHFKISSDDGMLSFRSSPNYEMPRGQPLDDNTNTNTYRLVVQASDGNNRDAYKVLVTVTNEDEPGKVTWTVGPGGTQLNPPRSLLQFRTGAQLVATVADDDGVVDADTMWKWFSGSSEIPDETGDTYTVADDDVNNRIRAEATYRESADRPTETVGFTSQNPVLADRTATNNDPVFASDAVSRGIAENVAAGDSVGGPITATDADNDRLTYYIPANDNLVINAATGRLTVKAGAMLNHEDTDLTNNALAEITVTVTDPSGATDTTEVTVNITDVNEAPIFEDGTVGDTANPSVAAIAENSMEAALQVGTYNAMDPDGDTPSLSLMGPDEGMFQLAANTGTSPTVTRIVSFKESPNYDMPGDSNGDNVYEVTVRASDGANHKDMQVAVKVIDVDEDGKLKLSSQDAQIGVELTATLSDDDGGVPNVAQITDQKWTWYSLTAANDAIDAETARKVSEEATYTPKSTDSGRFLKASVSYTDPHGMKTLTSTDAEATRAVRAASANQAPEFSEGVSTFRIIMENAKPNVPGRTDGTESQGNVGSPIMAMDVNDDTLAYTLSGTDAALFKVDPVADDPDTPNANENLMPQIEVKSGTKLNYETRSRYSVTLTANDGSATPNATARITVTIYVTDVDEKPKIMVVPTENQAPMFPSSTATRSIPEGESLGRPIGAAVTATDPNPGDRLAYTLEGTDADSFTIVGNTGQLRTRVSLVRDTKSTYTVTVKATDGDGLYDTITVTITVTEMGEQMGEVTLWASATEALTMAPQVGETITGAVMDPDVPVNVTAWQWSRTMTPDVMDSWMDITGATDAAYMVTAGDDGYYLRVMATYTDAVGTDTAMVYSEETMMVGAMAEEMTLLGRYDTTPQDGSIQLEEARVAVGDYFVEPKGSVLSLQDAREVVGLYFEYKNSQ